MTPSRQPQEGVIEIKLDWNGSSSSLIDPNFVDRAHALTALKILSHACGDKA